MRCEKYLPALLEAADDRLDALDAGERERLDAHLRGCAACRLALAEQRATRMALAARPAALAPAGLASRVVATVRADPHWMDLLHWRMWALRLAPVAAALLLMAGFALRAAPAPDAAASGVRQLADVWTYGASEGGALPAYALLGQDDVGGELLLDTILSTAPDETLAVGEQS